MATPNKFSRPTDPQTDEEWEKEALKFEFTHENWQDYRDQVYLGREVIDEVIAEEQAALENPNV